MIDSEVHHSQHRTSPIKRWQFWIDRGGTFTDIVAQLPSGHIKVHKVLSVSNLDQDTDPVLNGMAFLMGGTLRPSLIESVHIGTTLATNALLEDQGARTVLITNQGLGDLLKIGNQSRADLFKLNLPPRKGVYDSVIEVEVRVNAQESPEVAIVIKAMHHALFARRPKIRYRVGWDAQLAHGLNWLPRRFLDWLLIKLLW